MKFVSRLVVSFAFVAALAVTASAQGRPGAGTTGGFGFGGGSVYSFVSTNKVLQDELKITDEQKKKIEDALKPISEKRRELFGAGGGRPGAGGNQPTEEQRKELGEKMAKLSEETKKAVEGALDEKQAKRLGEINIQYMGFAAYSNKDVQEKLKLNDEQKAKIKTVAEEYAKDSAELRKDAPRGGRPGAQQSDEDKAKQAEYNKKRDALRAEAEDKVVAVLTAEQKTAWKGLVGEKFDTSKLMQGFGQRTRRDN